MKTLSIVIPVYFNAESLPVLFERLKDIELRITTLEMALELIFVDDGSGDNSLAVLLDIKQSRPATKVIKLTRNFGAVHASKCGLQHATGDCFMILAADLQDPPELIMEMVQKWQAGSKFTICVRNSREDPAASKLFAVIYYWLLHKLVISDYPSGGYDMALIDKRLIPHLQNSSKNLYTPLLAYWLGYKPEVIYYRRAKREHGKSRWTFTKKFKAFLDVMLGFSVTPIRLISCIGAIISACSFAYGINIVIHALLGDIYVPGFASIAALITFLLGLIILMLGMMGEYLWRVFDELNKRPEVVIEEIY
ncbi:MAG TPA: glycosyltransferase family 2 protein [Rickettsiales bacterium]|nr:glycosyltransferase family 2 protein [Rickettsiales bacterium]